MNNFELDEYISMYLGTYFDENKYYLTVISNVDINIYDRFFRFIDTDIISYKKTFIKYICYLLKKYKNVKYVYNNILLLKENAIRYYRNWIKKIYLDGNYITDKNFF